MADIQLSNHIELSECVASYMIQQDISNHQEFRLLQIALRGLRQLNYDVVGEIKTELLEVNNNKTAQLPVDYLNYIKVGVINNRGEIATFSRNNDLSKYHAFCDDRMVVDSTTDLDNVYLNYVSGGINLSLYGIGSDNTIGEFNIDDKKGVIYFGLDTDVSNVVMEYLSNGMWNIDGKYYIHIFAQEALIAWIRWQDMIGKARSIAKADINMARMEYFNEKRNLRSRLKAFRANEYNDQIRKATKLAVKA